MLREPYMQLGTDPEFFFDWRGGPCAAEKVLPEKGLAAINRKQQYTRRPKAIFVDGIQAEMNTNAFSNRADIVNEMADAFATLQNHLKTLEGNGDKVTVNFGQCINFDAQFMAGVSEKNKEWLSEPSKNAYGMSPENANVDPKTYYKRIAGGHLHFGLIGSPLYSAFEDHRERAVPLLDIFVGNTCVLMDRDNSVVERRKTYGLAGEYRLPVHGLEYRTPSNFWLYHPLLAQLVFGLGRLAFGVLHETVKFNHDLESRLTETINIEDVIQAIMENDVDLAWKNYHALRPFIVEHCTEQNSGLRPSLLLQFEFFCKMIQEKGLTHWFPEDPLKVWAEWPNSGDDAQWEEWCKRNVIVSQ